MPQLSNATPGQLRAAGLEPIGPVVRLQVQTSSLKLGDRPHRWYDPAPIAVVASLRLDDGGVTGIDERGEPVADVHHRDHPRSKFRGDNGVSIGFTSHYSRMRARFGHHLTDGVAAENILIERSETVAEHELAGDVVILTRHGQIRLTGIQFAAPCVEFSRFCAGFARDRQSDQAITEALQFLSGGTRGFYATLGPPGASPAIVATGDLACRVIAG